MVNFTGASLDHYQEFWYAVQTRSRHEKFVHQHLLMRNVVTYLPVITETHTWSDRRQNVEVPLFPGYVFVRLIPHNEWRVKVLRIPGVVRFVGCTSEGSTIPDDQITSVKTILEHQINCVSCPFLRVGQRVRIKGGALNGVEGIFLRRSGNDALVVSIDAIQKSLLVTIRGYNVEVLQDSTAA